MTTINSDQFREICNAVWNDRAAVVGRCGDLSGETALVRAVFWRLCKVGVRSTGYVDDYSSKPTTLAYQLVVNHMLNVHARPFFDGAPILNELVTRYQAEGARSGERVTYESYR